MTIEFNPEWAYDLGFTADPTTLNLFVRARDWTVSVDTGAFWTFAQSDAGVALDVLGNTPDGRFPPIYWAERVGRRFPNEFTEPRIQKRPDAAQWADALTAELA